MCACPYGSVWWLLFHIFLRRQRPSPTGERCRSSGTAVVDITPTLNPPNHLPSTTRAHGPACTISRHRTILNDRKRAVEGAKSADPAVFTPLRLQCSLKKRGVGGGGTRCSNNGKDQSPRTPRRRADEPAGGGVQTGRQAFLHGAATLSLRGEMVMPALGVRLTPIAAPALLHTALFQSLLTRGAEARLQSG